MQLELPMTDVPIPLPSAWDALDEQQRMELLEVLARLIAKAAREQLLLEDVGDE